jgi:hypothetical protein
MSGTASITFCFDKSFKAPGLHKVLSFLLNNHAEKLFCLDYYENGIKKKLYNIDLKQLNTNLPPDTMDFFMMYDWDKPEGLIPEAANEINNYFESNERDPFKLFHISFCSGVFNTGEDEVFEEVEAFASNFMIYFYTETNTIIYDRENFEQNLRNNPKVQKLIHAFENEFNAKVIKIGVSISI